MFSNPHLSRTEKIIRIFALVIIGCILNIYAVLLFHHLTQFETSDEDLWKEKRITQFWKGMEEGRVTGDWSNTAINDKPGISMVLLASLGLADIPDPTKVEELKKTNGKYLYVSYKTEYSELINYGLRVPIVIFTLIVVALSSWLIYLWSSSLAITVFSSLFIVLNPVLLGISQNINPDAVLWSSSLIALLFYILSLRRGWWLPLIFSGVFFGWAILAKYTGNLLTVFFLILLLGFLVFSLEMVTRKKYQWEVFKRLLQLIIITTIGYAIFAVLFPLALFEPEYFTKGTFLSRGMEPIIKPILILFLFLLLDAVVFGSRLLFWFSSKVRLFLPWMLRFFAGIFLAVLLIHIFNAWTGANIIPLNDIREIIEDGAYGNVVNKNVFSIPLKEGDTKVSVFFRKILFESSYTVFTLPTGVVFILIVGLGFMVYRGRSILEEYTLFALSAPWVFFIGGIMANVLVNVRYGILLQFILSLLAGILIVNIVNELKVLRVRRWVYTILFLLFSSLQGWAIFSTIPFSLNYQNDFLPLRYSFADSWSYGMYEAAQYLNALPNATELKVWSDRRAFCRYFVGKCIKSQTIDLAYIKPDYFVVSRRNVVKGEWFKWKNPPEGIRDSAWYYSDESMNNPAWQILIGNRPLNYIKVFSFQENIDQ